MTKEEKISEVIGYYNGMKSMIRIASDEMFRMLPVNKAGETSAEALLELNQWVEHMESNANFYLTKSIIRINKEAADGNSSKQGNDI